MALWVKALVAMPGDLRSRSQMGRRTDSCKLTSDLHIYTVAYTYACTCMWAPNKNILKKIPLGNGSKIQRDTGNLDKHIKRGAVSLAMREMQNKDTMSSY